eukprot:535169-Amphidinium_carterae.2
MNTSQCSADASPASITCTPLDHRPQNVGLDVAGHLEVEIASIKVVDEQPVQCTVFQSFFQMDCLQHDAS